MAHPVPDPQYAPPHPATLRQANRHYAALFLNELLPANARHVLAQVDNLRSNNSKEALTLLTELIQTQDLAHLEAAVIRPFIAALMSKSVSEKGFLKTQANKALSLLPPKWNPWAFEELCLHTQAANGVISELAIKLVGEMLEHKKDYEVDSRFLKNLSSNLNGKRAVVQKKAREILKGLKERVGEEKLEGTITSSTELLEEESTTLRRELKEKEEKAKGPSLKEFLKAKKQQPDA